MADSIFVTDFVEDSNSASPTPLFSNKFDFNGNDDGNGEDHGWSSNEDDLSTGRTFNGTASDNTFDVIGDQNTFNGNGGNDSFDVIGNDNLLSGSSGRDRFTVVGENNTLNGRAGADVLDVVGGGNTLNGGQGADTLIATGNNTLNGGMGRDRFLLSPFTVAPFINRGDPGQSLIQDFQDGVDTLVLPIARAINTSAGQTQRLIRFNELTIRQQAQGTAISFRGRSLALLRGVQTNQITAADFSVPDAFETSLISLRG